MTTWASTVPIPNPSNSWTDGTITAGATRVKLQHLVELREFMEGMDGHYHVFEEDISASNPDMDTDWVEGTNDLEAGVTRVKASHWEELRESLENLGDHTHTAKGYTSTTVDIDTTWTEDDPLVGETDYPKKTHIQDLRDACDILKNHTHTVCCDSECGCVAHCGGWCGENCESECWYFD